MNTICRTNTVLRVSSVVACLLLQTSCKERIEISTDNINPKPAISCLLTTDTGRCYVQVSRTLAYFGKDSAETYDATVKLDGERLEFVQGSGGSYRTDSTFRGIPGRSYRLEVWFDFDEDGEPEYYHAEATMPRMVDLDSITLSSISVSGAEYKDPPWLVVVHFQDEPGRDYYGANMYVNGVKFSFSYANYYLNQFDANIEDGRYIRFPTYYVDDEFNWYKDTKMYLQAGDTITIELNNMSENYYNFVKTAKLEVSGSNPLFAGPPANVPGNISNGAVGIFGTYTVSRKSLILPETEHFKKKR